MNLIDLLPLAGIDISKSIKIIRHSSKDNEIVKVFTENREVLEQYQALQKPNLLNCDYVVSCIKDKNRTIVQAVYAVEGHRAAQPADIPSHTLIQELMKKEDIQQLSYTLLKRVNSFEELEQRIVIDWGKSAISWQQSLNNNPKPVIEIRAKGKIEEFLDYDQVLLTYHQLQDMVKYPEANREWHQMLSVNGIYLISNNKTGQLYVGSAYGVNGILGRWRDYAITGHGGNERLKHLMKHDQYAMQDMQYSILTTVASNKTNKEIVNLENFYKKKLGKSAVTLNHEGYMSDEVQAERRKLLLNYLQQFLDEQQVTDKSTELPSTKYSKVNLTNTEKLFYAFISEDGINELLLVKQLKIGHYSLYLEFGLDGKRHLVTQPWQREYLLELNQLPKQDGIIINSEVREIGVIDKSDPAYDQLTVEGRLGYGHSNDETEFKEIIAQLSGKDGWYDAYIMNERI